VNCKQALEDNGLGFKRSQNKRADARESIEREHQLSHERRTARHAAMRCLILVQVVYDQGVSERGGLSKSEAHAFAGDRIDRSGSVSN
jgi:hypothetical protein